MPTKRRRVPHVQRPALSPAAIYLLMTGRISASYLFGWANLHWDMAPFNHDPLAWRHSVLTPQIGAWLDTEGRTYGVEPWALTGRCPRRADVTAWERAFRAEHGRHP
jgi:hypothetical protein